jgi:CBS-domain-containing membrane protein
VAVRILDQGFKKNPRRYVAQCALATATIMAILFALDIDRNTAIIASLGATAFIVFAMPGARSSATRRLLGGYVVGMAIGALFGALSSLHLAERLFAVGDFSHIVFGSIAVGLTTLIMAMTNTEHPPAAGIALGLVINESGPFTLFVIGAAVVIMALVKRLLRDWLIDLV